MKQTIEITRDSIKMTIMAISADAIPEKARSYVLRMVENRLTAILKQCPDKFFRVTVETFDEVPTSNTSEG